jgi:hypothetical protein
VQQRGHFAVEEVGEPGACIAAAVPPVQVSEVVTHGMQPQHVTHADAAGAAFRDGSVRGSKGPLPAGIGAGLGYEGVARGLSVSIDLATQRSPPGHG